VIVAVAIVCIVVAVLSSAQRADDVAVEHERQLLSHAISNYGERVLREGESVATSDGAVRNIRIAFDPNWAKERAGLWLQTFFDHDAVLVFDGEDKPIYSLLAPDNPSPSLLDATRPSMVSVLDFMRGHDPTLPGAIRLDELNLT